MKKIKIIIVSFCTLLLPSFILRVVLRLFGFKIGNGVKIGFSIIKSNTIILENNVKIGHFNLILNDKIHLKEDSIIGYLNILKGPFSVLLDNKAAIGNKNYMTRAKTGITFGKSLLHLGNLTKITVGHHLDLTQSIIFGENSILAGIKSQLWTHGYYHADIGKDRIRIDGEIYIGNNVYIGSSCVFNPGVKVGNSIHIGGGSTISKDLNKSGMYVGQGLRFIENNIDTVKNKLTKIVDKNLVEQVYKK